MSNVLLVNITWNPNGWRDNSYVNSKAGHKYARNSVGGESLNFDFDKEGVDTEKYIYGYFRSTNTPKSFEEGGIIIFYTKNTDQKKGQIVGVYGNANVFEMESIPVDFQNDDYYYNIEGDRDLSLLFPVPLDSKPFKGEQRRLVPQVGFTYKDGAFAKEIISKELRALERKSIVNREYEKLVNLYEQFFETKYIAQESDEAEQLEITDILQTLTQKQFKEKFDDLGTAEENELVSFEGKRYKRNNYNMALIKRARNYECQICRGYVLKKNGDRYVEAAHITPKYLKGKETPDNTLILCPNHHKEFDFGKVDIIERSTSEIEFTMNGKRYLVSLKDEL